MPLNKEEEEFMNKLEKKSTFSRMNSISNNLTLNYTTTIRDQNWFFFNIYIVICIKFKIFYFFCYIGFGNKYLYKIYHVIQKRIY